MTSERGLEVSNIARSGNCNTPHNISNEGCQALCGVEGAGGWVGGEVVGG